jgi:serine phosphatase RsbU (regulator of sigma subunit)
LSALAHQESGEDFIHLDRLIGEFYRVICFEEGGAPDFERLAALFSQHARITRITPEGIDHLDVEGFSALVRELLELGAFTSFYEHELKRSAHRYGRVFHIASAYETKAAPDAVDYLERGVNSMQVLREQDGWRIVSLCWDSGSFEPDGRFMFN